MAGRRLRRGDYTVGWVCALPIELAAAQEMLDEEHRKLPIDYNADDTNIYTFGRIGDHNVVLACLPEGQMGTNSAAAVSVQMKATFKSIRFYLMVGIGGGVPSKEADIRLGDVVVSRPQNLHGGVVQYDFGKATPSGFERTGFLNAPPTTLLNAVANLRAIHFRGRSKLSEYISKLNSLPEFTRESAGTDLLFAADYNHVGGDICERCDKERVVDRQQRSQEIMIHYGTIASGNEVMRDGVTRDKVSSQLEGVLCFEMEAAGLMNRLPCLVIRGICDYADSHKNKRWQGYAAGTAAACAKELLSVIPPAEVRKPRTANDITREENDWLETPPGPTSTVPFRRDDDFISRGALLDQIHKKVSAPGSRTALVGLGGVGKSQLAIEYTYQIRDRSPQTWVFWIHASNADRFEQGYREIADLVKVPGRSNSKADIFKLVHDWLRDERRKWVVILDNVDDAGFLLEASCSKRPAQPLLTYLPQTRNGSTLITARSKHEALKLVEETDIIAVEPMDEVHALALFEKKLGAQNDKNDIAELIMALEFMPLAIVQAAAYIHQRAPRYSVRQYKEKFQKSEKGKSSLLNYEAGHLRRDREAKSSVIITWQISFDHIRQTRPSATNLLSLMSFFDRQGISEALVRNRFEIDNQQRSLSRENEDEGNIAEDSESEFNTDDEFEDDIVILRDYSFISVSIDNARFEMHELVQLATRKWLEAHGELEKWKEQFIKILYIEFPTGEYENWVECQELFPHVKSGLARKPEHEKSLREWASILYNAAWYAWARGSPADAEKMSVQSMKTRKKLLGQGHVETLASMEMVGLAYHLGGRWKEAEELEVQVMATRKRVLGMEHPDTLTSMANLASTFWNQGRWKEAEELFVQVIETRKRMLGVEHPSTLTSMANLASTYRNQGRWKEAEELGVQAMETGKRVLGMEHPDTLTSMNNLAFTLKEQGQVKQAIALMEDCIRMRKQVLGPDHPFTKDSQIALNSWRTSGTHKEQDR